jgi:hypothetical protein
MILLFMASDNSPIWVNKTYIQAVVHNKIMLNGTWFNVCENADSILEKLK